MTTNYKDIILNQFKKIELIKVETPSAGTKYRLMGLAADVTELAQMLQNEVLSKVLKDALLDIDVDVDFTELSEQVLSQELHLDSVSDDMILKHVNLVNEELGELSNVLVMIAEQMERHHKDDEYERVYDIEKRRYMSSGTAHRERQAFEEWKEINRDFTQDDIVDYIIEKQMKMFETGVFNVRVEQIKRAKRFPSEFDFDKVDDDPKITKTVYHHYMVLRKLADFKDGMLFVKPASVGRHFYMSRKENNAKQNRTNFLKYMHKINLAQEEYQRLKVEQQAAADTPQSQEEQLNFFAPTKHLTLLLQEEWFSLLTTNENLYVQQWRQQMVEALMATEWGEQIARDWAVSEKRLTLKCMIVGCLKDAGVIKGSYNQIAKLLDFDDENTATLAKYLGMGKKQPYADWISDYVKSA